VNEKTKFYIPLDTLQVMLETSLSDNHLHWYSQQQKQQQKSN